MGEQASTPRRIVTRVIVFLLLGAIVNVAVAWGLAYRIEFDSRARSNQQTVDRFTAWGLPDGHPDADRFRGYTALRYKRFGSQRVFVFQLFMFSGQPGHTTISFQEIIPQWSRSYLSIPELNGREPDLRGEAHTHNAILDARGWPCLALWGCLKRPGLGLTIYDDAGKPIPLIERQHCIIPIHIPSGSVSFTEFRWLPWHPIWPGFAVNAIFYAAILWLLWAAPGAIRRMRRKQRGLCIHCGYDLRGAAPDSRKCPECGKATDSRR